MKKADIYFFLIATLFLITGCDKPAPTELVDDQENLQVEVISSDPDDEYYSTGFDSTGMTENPIDYTNLVTVSGIKTTRNSSTAKISFAQAVFFDRNSPVFGPGGKLLGYRTKNPGVITFNNIPAQLQPFRINFRGHGGGHADTSLGFRYVLSSDRGNQNNFNFPFNSIVAFEFVPVLPGKRISIDIPTPKEITASAKVTGKFADKNLTVQLEWNRADHNDFELIIGTMIRGKENVVPLFRVKTEDDGQLIIPSNLINQIPPDRFNHLLFSLIRKIESDYTEGSTEFHVISTSIYSIVIENP